MPEIRTLSLRIVLAFFAVAMPLMGMAQQSLVGDWDIKTTGFAFNGATSHVDLVVEADGNSLAAYIYNGPVPVRLDGDNFEIDLDWATAFDTVHVSTFRGRITEAGTLEGVVDHNGDLNFLGAEMRGGTFSGQRANPEPRPAAATAEKVDLSGVWNRAFGLWPVRKLNYAMTESGQSVVDNYKEMDNGNSRCASMGLVMAAGMPYPMEILTTDEHLVIAYGADYVRRVYLDGREFPDNATSSSLGFSRGEWQGDTLVVTTTELSPSFMSTRGQPISENAYTVEHFYLDDRGYLHADMWLHDPVNYLRPPYIRRVMDRDFSPNVITKIGCDPYSFFRALYLDGNLEEFWERARYRR